MTEEWKPIPEYPDYEASTLGRIRSLDMVRDFGARKKVCKGRVLSPWSHRNGYLVVGISGGKRRYVHQLIASAFIERSHDAECINHINGDKADNRPGNLEFATYSRNMMHKTRILKKNIGEDNGMAKLTEKSVLEIRTSQLTTRQLGDIYGVHPVLISLIKRRKAWRHI